MSESEYDGYSTVTGTNKDTDIVDNVMKLHKGRLL